MTFGEYVVECLLTAHYPGKGNNLVYPTLGLAGEAGEFANIVKKIQRDLNGELTEEVRAKLIDELGDVLWYVAMLSFELGISLEGVAKSNIRKLQKRYGNLRKDKEVVGVSDGAKVGE